MLRFTQLGKDRNWESRERPGAALPSLLISPHLLMPSSDWPVPSLPQVLCPHRTLTALILGEGGNRDCQDFRT